MNRCARCRRPILSPVIVEGRGYGKHCASLLGDLLTPAPVRIAGRSRIRRADARQLVIVEVQR